jgi:adenosylhomocysteinase
MTTLDELAFAAEQDVGATRLFFPVLQRLGDAWARSRPWADVAIGLNLHLTTLTAALVDELQLGGARCLVSGANPGTSDAGTTQFLRNRGLEVYTGGGREDRHAQLLAHGPSLLVDTGAELVEAALAQPAGVPQPLGAVVLTRRGIERLRRRNLPFPVVDLTAGRLHDTVENGTGIGEAVWRAVSSLTGIALAGRRAAVVGYGPVGRGIAAWARSAGMVVEIVESDPVRRLFAHYDGFATPDLADAVRRVRVVVTATGRSGVIGEAALREARRGLVLVNAGTGGDEIDVAGLKRAADVVDHIHDGVVRYGFEDGHSVVVLGDGLPLNIVTNSGSPEPVLLQYAVAGLALAWLAGEHVPAGIVPVPGVLEEQAAQLALAVLDEPGA